MSRHKENRRILFDLNHPADFHFFKHLMAHLNENGYRLKVVARDKECLHQLLQSAGIAYINRGSGSNSTLGKYVYSLYIVALILVLLVRFRPGLAISLSSPYLVLASRILGIQSLTYDDTDDNPRLLSIIKHSTYLLSPVHYPHQFHKNHFHLRTFKELAYLHPNRFRSETPGNGIFFRLARTDSIHHSPGSRVNVPAIIAQINRYSEQNPALFSAEVEVNPDQVKGVRMADRLQIHKELAGCRVFWGNSATMAAEAAVLGIPAIFVSAEKFSYISELEAYGLLFHYTPDQMGGSFAKLDELLRNDSMRESFREARTQLLNDKIDASRFLIWFAGNLPGSARIMREDPDYQLTFRGLISYQHGQNDAV